MRPPGKYWPGHLLDPSDPPSDDRAYVWEDGPFGIMCVKARDLTAHERLAAVFRAKTEQIPGNTSLTAAAPDA